MTAASASLLGAALRALRKEARLSRIDAAKTVGVSLRTLDSDERGERDPGVPCDRLDDYAQAYGVSVSAVLARAGSDDFSTKTVEGSDELATLPS